jgi:hypothetical protein
VVEVVNRRLPVRHDSPFPQMVVWSAGLAGEAATPAVPAMIAFLEDGTTALADRAQALSALASIGPGARAALPLVEEYLASDSMKLRACAARALWGITGETERVVPVYVEGMRQRGDTAYWTPRWLGDLGPAAAAAVPILREALSGEVSWDAIPAYRDIVRCQAAGSLWRIAGDAEAGLPVLRETLRAGSLGNAGLEALRSIHDMGAAARSLAPDLRAIVADPDRPLRERRLALEALQAVTGDDAGPR